MGQDEPAIQISTSQIFSFKSLRTHTHPHAGPTTLPGQLKWSDTSVAIETLATDAGDVVLVAESLRQQTVAYFPGEDGRALALVLGDACDHLGRRYARLAAADGTRSN